jgi:hypothetical protein
MALSRTYTKTIVNKAKFTDEVSTLDNYSYWSALGDQLTVYLTIDFTTQQETDLDSIVANWVDYTTAETLTDYLDKEVFPFIKTVVNTFAAENMAMGITQAGKTGEVLGLFIKSYDVHLNGLPISLRDTFDTGSLYEACTVIQYIRDNPTEFTGMSPYITDARLLEMKNKIEIFLGIPLST